MEKNVFRAYDIRGIYPSEINEDFAYTFGLAFGSKMRRENKTSTLVGYDNRSSSKSLYNSLTKGLLDSGIDVISIGFVTSPMCYFARDFFNTKSSIMITASHSPKEYNGFKISFNGIYNAYENDIQDFYSFILEKDFTSGSGFLTEENINSKYIDSLLKDININRKLKVVLDAGNGSTSVVIKDVFDKLNIDYIPLFFESDSNFPNHHPDPSVYSTLDTLRKEVVKNNAGIGFAFDGDGDRLGIVDELGNIIKIDHFIIIILRNIMKDLKNKRILYDVKCSKSLEDEIEKLGGIKYLSKTGASILRATLVKENLSFAGEFSGHIFFNDKYAGYDDGIYASLRMLEILSNSNKKTSELLEGVEHYYSTPEIKIDVTDENKFEIVEKIKKYCIEKDYKFIDIDGCRILFDDGFALIRASNTGPNLTLRFESKSEIKLKDMEIEFRNKIEEFI